MERMALEWLYNIDPTNSELQFIANYVLSLCRGANLAAINITGGGSIAPTGGSSVRPDKLDFTVADSGSIMISGQSVLYIDGSGGLPDMRGFEIIFSRGALVQSINDVGGSYYTWNSYNGKFECFGSANLDEQFIIQPTI
jgi:hypothetical protein